MKKLFLTGAMLVSAAAATYAANIRIEVDGTFVSGSVGPNSVSVTCSPGGCCAVITIYAVAQSPQVGDRTLFQQTEGTYENVVHQWSGNYLNHQVNKTSTGKDARVDFLRAPHQDF